jgi:hypothetical protein
LDFQDLRTEINLRSPNGSILAAHTINHTTHGNVYDPVSASLVIPSPTTAGKYDIQMLVYDATTNIIQDIEIRSFYVKNTMSFMSAGTHDGWILESTENSTTGGILNSTATIFNLGDEAGDKQYRAILSFNTSGLPDNAVITKATLKIKKAGLMGTNPFNLLGGLKVDIKKPYFGTNLVLALGDFQAAPTSPGVATFGTVPVNNWYSAIFGTAGRSNINTTGKTQLRLSFTKDDNDDLGADYMFFYSGNYSLSSAWPKLIIEYYVP